MAIRIITDSTCDITREDQEHFNIKVIPLTVNFADASYEDGVGISNEDFYNKLDSCKVLPTTSSVAPQTFTTAFNECLDAGDEIVGIFISGDISGTYHAACMAKEALASDKIHLVDSRNTTLAMALLVFEAAKNRDEGMAAADIAEHIRSLTPKVRLMAMVNTLKYLHKGGRLSLASTVVGEVLGIKPITSVVDGKVAAIGKARGIPATFKTMLQKALDDLPDLNYGFIFGHICAPELLEKLIDYMKDPLQLTEWFTSNIGCIVGTHTGRGAVGFAYIAV